MTSGTLIPERRLPGIDELSRKYHAVLVRYFQRRGIHHSDAQDLAQDVFYRLARQGPLDGVGSLEGYLFATAANVARDMFRRARVRGDNPAEGFIEEIQVTEEFSPERRLAG